MKPRVFLRDFMYEFRRDSLTDVAAMMTYYAVFALFPMAVFVLTMGLLVLPQKTISDGVAMIVQTMPGQAASILRSNVARLQGAAGQGIALGSAALALFGASRGVVSLSRALNNVFNTPETRPWWKVQVTGILATLAIAFLVVIALGLLSAGALAGSYLGRTLGAPAAVMTAWGIARWLCAAVLVMFLWAVLYKYLPDNRGPFKVLTFGSVVGVLLWIGASALFGIYVSNFGSYEKTYGVLGAVVVFLLWLWISNLALLIGAEINDVIEKDAARRERARTRRVSRVGEGMPA